MKTRQAVLFFAFLALLFILPACSSSNQIPSTETATPVISTASATLTATASPVPETSTPTPLACLQEAGEVKQEVVPDTNPPQEFLIYLPPCYAQSKDEYPVIYLLHGQTYTQDQWVRMGVPLIADELIHSGKSIPFIVVFPDDHYWYAPAGAGFGQRLINNIIPQVDRDYRTLTNREDRALGGLSLGGGWTLQLGLEHPELFGSLGLHSPGVFPDTALFIEENIVKIPQDDRPRLWLDIGDADRELGSVLQLEDVLTRTDYLHQFHLFSGDHSEIYWGAHVEQYLRWYTSAWQGTADP